MARVLCSDGKAAATAYVLVPVPASGEQPTPPAERVQFVHPQRTPTVRHDAPSQTFGPRNPDQREWPSPEPPGIELPDGLPATEPQRVIIDPELVARWRAEARANKERP